MSRITLDESTLAQLVGIHDQAEICDSQGSVIGYFQPIPKREPGTPFVPHFTEEELQRFDDEPGARTLDEIFRDLRKRT